MSSAVPILEPQKTKPADPLPVCPHCLQDPATLQARGPLRLGNAQVIIVFCGNQECRKVWNTQILGIEQPRVVPGAKYPGRA